jgi:outer membrane lipoprotein SlyB
MQVRKDVIMASKTTYWEKLFHTCAIVWGIAFLVGYTGIASASTSSTIVVNAKITDHTKTIIQRTPYEVQVCSDVQVSGDKTADALTGAIIGGIIGNNITKDLPDGGTAGAIIGGILGHSNSDAKGGTQRQCTTQKHYKEEMISQYSHSTITFTENGRTRTIRFQK